MNYAKMNDREREAFNRAKKAAETITAVMQWMTDHPEENASVWAMHAKAQEIAAAAYNIHNRIYR